MGTVRLIARRRQDSVLAVVYAVSLLILVVVVTTAYMNGTEVVISSSGQTVALPWFLAGSLISLGMGLYRIAVLLRSGLYERNGKVVVLGSIRARPVYKQSAVKVVSVKRRTFGGTGGGGIGIKFFRPFTRFTPTISNGRREIRLHFLASDNIESAKRTAIAIEEAIREVYNRTK